MKNYSTAFVIIFILVPIVFSCKHANKKNDRDDLNNVQLFEIKTHLETGIEFKNTVHENRNLNGILYEYLYNGAGVAIADFNGDDLADIYFLSNQNSNKLYLNKEDLTFEDITQVSKVSGGNGFPTGVTIVDINSDGRQDIYVCKSGKYSNPDVRRNELYINLGNNEQGIPVFKERAKMYGLDLPHFSTQASFFDYDKDGDLDLFLINHGTQPYEDEVTEKLFETTSSFQSSRLFRNDNNYFVDVSDASGIINNAISFGLGLAVGDFNNDSWPDVLVGHDFSEKDHLYLNQKNGKFKEVILESTNHISFFSMGNDIADINNDGWMDFMSLDMMSDNNYEIKTSMSGMNPKRFYSLFNMGLHHQYMFNTLQLNNGIMDSKNDIPVFSDVAQLMGVSSTDWSWGPLLFDMDNDGWKDIFVSNGIKRDFRNNDFLIYKKKKFDTFFGTYGEKTDANKQLARDLILEMVYKMPQRKKPNYFFKNSQGVFEKKNQIWVQDIDTNSNGGAYADLDNDGDLDIVVNNMDDFAMIYENKSSETTENNYLQIKLKGSEKNVNAIGVRVELIQNGKHQILENYATRGFQSASIDKLHFGTGKSKVIDTIKVFWNDNQMSVFENLAVNQVFEVNYKTAPKNPADSQKKKATLFNDITAKTNLRFKHEENEFDDFSRESLLPHKLSHLGPALATADINGDGLDDIYIGGAHGFKGKLFIQSEQGAFYEKNIPEFSKDGQYEDVAAVFFDADLDGKPDLYVVSGGNEFDEGSPMLQDRLYKNVGNAQFERIHNFPHLKISGSCAKVCDYDLDGDLDIFIGGRQKPGRYPEPSDSYILENKSVDGDIKFVNATNEFAQELLNLGMVTDAVWFDANKDKWQDLLVVGEWMSPTLFINKNGKLSKTKSDAGLSEDIGWWFSVASEDFDNDGDQDFIAGNIGLNYKYKASVESPFEVYLNDFDENGSLDIILGYHEMGNLYPLRGRECSSNQVPAIKSKFKDYHSFAQATLPEVYGSKKLNNALHYKATNFATTYFENLGNGTFRGKPLGKIVQYSSTNAICIEDINRDGIKDVILAGNWYPSEVETPRNDAGYGVCLIGDGKGGFTEKPPVASGFYAKGDLRRMKIINMPNAKKAVVLAKNLDAAQIIAVE